MQTKRFVSPLDLFSVKLEKPADGSPITLRLPVLPKGTFKHQIYGDLNWTDERFERMIGNFNAQVTGYAPMLNADHSTHNPFAAGAPAYGWPKSLERDAAGLWAHVELTDLGEEAIRNRRYRYISAEVADEYARSTGASAEDVIVGMALTNTPFHDTMPGIFSREAVPDAQALQRELQAFAMNGEPSFEDIRRAIGEALQAETQDQSSYCYVLEVFPSFVIYEHYDYSTGLTTERFYKRAYAYSDGTITLGVDKVQVEQVWAVKAQQAFRQALRAHLLSQPGQTGSRPDGGHATGGNPAPGANRMTLLELARKVFGLADTATEADVAVKLAAAGSQPVPASVEIIGEPMKPQEFKAPAGHVLLSESEVTQLRADAGKVAGLQAQVNELSAKVNTGAAEMMIQGYMAAGKITPAMRQGEKDGEDPILDFALADPIRFKQIYDRAPVVVEFTRKGGLKPEGGNAEAPDEKTFGGIVAGLIAESGKSGAPLTYVDAVELAANQHPDLYEAHRKAATSGRSK